MARNPIASILVPVQEPRLRGALSIKDFARLFKISSCKVYDEIRQGRLHAKKVGTRTVIFMEEAERWASELPAVGLASDDGAEKKEKV